MPGASEQSLKPLKPLKLKLLKPLKLKPLQLLKLTRPWNNSRRAPTRKTLATTRVMRRSNRKKYPELNMTASRAKQTNGRTPNAFQPGLNFAAHRYPRLLRKQS